MTSLRLGSRFPIGTVLLKDTESSWHLFKRRPHPPAAESTSPTPFRALVPRVNSRRRTSKVQPILPANRFNGDAYHDSDVFRKICITFVSYFSLWLSFQG